MTVARALRRRATYQQSQPSTRTGTCGGSSFDELICPDEYRPRDSEPKRLGGLQVDRQLELDGLLHGEVSGLGPLENLVDIGRSAPVHVRNMGAVAHQPPRVDEFLHFINCREAVLRREVNNPLSVAGREAVGEREKRVGMLPGHCREGAIKIIRSADLDGLKLHSQYL